MAAVLSKWLQRSSSCLETGIVRERAYHLARVLAENGFIAEEDERIAAKMLLIPKMHRRLRNASVAMFLICDAEHGRMLLNAVD